MHQLRGFWISYLFAYYNKCCCEHWCMSFPMNICFISVGYTLRELQGQVVSLLLTFSCAAQRFSEVTLMHEGPSSPVSLPAAVCAPLPTAALMGSHCLVTRDTEQLLMGWLALGIFTLEKCIFSPFVHFKLDDLSFYCWFYFNIYTSSFTFFLCCILAMFSWFFACLPILLLLLEAVHLK